MPTFSKKPTFTRELPPIGTHIATCYQFIHIGTNEDSFKGEPTLFNKIRLSFELPDEMRTFGDKGEQLMSISQEYTLSMGKKANLRKLVEGIIGTALSDGEAYAFDVESLVGMSCLVTIIHKTSQAGNVRAEISTASPLMKSQKKPAQINPSKVLSYNNFDEAFFQSLPQFIKDKIVSSAEYQEMKNPSTLTEEEKRHIKDKVELYKNLKYPEDKNSDGSELPDAF